MLQNYAGFLENLRPLLGAYVKGVHRSIRPVPASRLPTEAPPDLWFTADDIRVTPQRVGAYLEVTDGVDLGGGAQGYLPPLYFTNWFLKPYLNVLGSDVLSLNLLGIVHLENELLVERPLKISDPITCRIGLEKLERNERRVLVTVLAENRVGDTVASQSRSLILARLPKGGGSSSGSSSKSQAPAGEAPVTEIPWRHLRTLSFGADHGRRYGLLTGDVNPIHLHPLTSQAFGFKRPIAHGFCLKAMVAHGLIRSLGGGDIGRLKRLNIRFKGAILLPGRAQLRVHEDRFQVTDTDGAKILAEGEFTMT